jgi:hypothetical protein
MPRRRLILALPAALAPTLWTALLPTDALAQSAEAGGVKFEPELALRGSRLLLNGAGVRVKFFVKVYAAGLYLPAKTASPEAAWDTKASRALRIAMLREVDAADLGKLLVSGMEKNASAEEFARAAPATARLTELFAARKKMAAGDAILIEWVPGTGTVVTINGKAEEPIADPEFFPLLMKVWLGRSPADADLKEALLGKG